MPTLDVRGKISAAEIAFYLPIAIVTAILVFRYAFRRDSGWLFLCLFSLIRMAGGALLVAAEQVEPTNIDLFISAYVLQQAAFGFLLLSCIGFVGMAGQTTYSEIPRVSLYLRIFGILSLAGIGVSIAGQLLGTHVSPDKDSTGLILRQVGAAIFAAVYVFLVMTNLGCWTYRYQMRTYRFKLLIGVTCAVPFLGVRAAYAILSAWSAKDVFGTQPINSPVFPKFNPVTGDWVVYLVMSLVMEYAVAAIYLFSSTVLSRRYHYD